MAGLKTIYDKQGKPLADIRGAVVRSSLLNEIGEATLIVPTSSSKCTPEILGYGNYVVVQDTDMPLWVGMIDPPRVWKKGYVEVHAYEPIYLMKSRYAPYRSRVQGTPGERMSFLIDAANAVESTIFTVGSVYSGGVSNEEIFEDDIFTHLKNMAKNNGQDWLVTPVISSSGLLELQISWREKLNGNVGLVLTQGRNVDAGESKLEEDGELISFAEVILDDTSNEEIETDITQTYQAGVTYGVRMKRIVMTGEATSATLQTIAEETVNAKKKTGIAVPLKVNNKDGATFNKIALGNTAIYRIPDAGFSSNGTIGLEMPIRIIGYRYDEAKKSCEIFPEAQGTL